MKRFKKLLLGLVALAAMAVLCAVCVGAETYGDYEYSVLADGTVKITGYTGSATTLSIPAKIDGKSVTSIGDEAFSYCSDLTSITIPDSVTSIGNWAFSHCYDLTSITISNSLTSIGEGTFYDCSGLESITIPSSVTSIGSGAFSYCSGLTSITIPDSVTSIGVEAFYNCYGLTSITIPDSVTSIGDGAFSGCSGLTSITIPDSVTSIGKFAFCDCSGLTSITIPDGVTSIGDLAFIGCSGLTAIKVSENNEYYISDNGVLFNKNKSELICYPAGKTDKSYSVPDSVASICDHAFSDCYGLTSITIPDSVTSIGVEAFYNTSLLNDQTTTVKYIGKWAVDCDANAESAVIKSGTVGIAGYAFSNCTGLTSITIPDGVTSIGYWAFSWCSGLTSITIPDSVTNIGEFAFCGCEGLTSITIPDGVTSIGNGAFSSCGGLTSITIPDNVTSIGEFAFAGCSGLISIDIPDSVTSIDRYAFYGCTGLTSITIPDGVTSIGEYAFGYCNGYNAGILKIDNFKIYCYSGTAGEAYAKENGFEYVLLDAQPTAVTGFTLGGRAADALRLNWTKNTSADGYIIEKYDGAKWVSIAKITSNATTTYRVTGLSAGTAYKFRMKAYKMDGSTALYSDYTATLSACTNPSAVTGLKLGGRASNALRLNWNKNTSANGYIIEQYKSGKWVRIAKITSNATTTYRVSGLATGTAYKFRMKAYKMSGSTAIYSAYTSTLSARTNPSNVTGVKIGGKASTALRLNWTKNTSADGYIVEIYKGGKWVRAAKITKNTTVTYRISGLAKNTTYKIRIKAYKMSGSTALYSGYTTISGKTTA